MKFLLETNSKIPPNKLPIQSITDDEGAYIDSPIDSSMSLGLNYFETMSDFCFFNNTPELIGHNKLKQLEFRSK